MSEIIMSVENLTKKFPVSGGKFLTACDDISFHVRKGQTIGINFGVASYLSDKLIVMSQGRIVEAGLTQAVVENPQHAYTKSLLASVPEMGRARYV